MLSLIVCSFWLGFAIQTEYTIRRPRNYLFHNGLKKCPVVNRRRTGRRGNCSVPASFSLLVRRRRGSGTWIPYAYPVHGGICWPREGLVYPLVVFRSG